MAEIDEKRMPFMAHLQELRERLVRSVIAVGVGEEQRFDRRAAPPRRT